MHEDRGTLAGQLARCVGANAVGGACAGEHSSAGGGMCGC